MLRTHCIVGNALQGVRAVRQCAYDMVACSVLTVQYLEEVGLEMLYVVRIRCMRLLDFWSSSTIACGAFLVLSECGCLPPVSALQGSNKIHAVFLARFLRDTPAGR